MGRASSNGVRVHDGCRNDRLPAVNTQPALSAALCGDLSVAESREWLVTNGLGGFAAGTVAGTLTRRYHGLLFAALKPPVGRMLLCPKVDACVDYGGREYALATDRWADGTLAPQGFVHTTGFRLEGSVPVWSLTCGDAVLERRVWMEHDANRTYLQYVCVRAGEPLGLSLAAFVNCRDLHGQTHAGTWTMNVRMAAGGLTIVPFAGAPTIWLRADRGGVVPEHTWYRNYALRAEEARGLDATEDHVRAGVFTCELAAGDALTLVIGDAPVPIVDGAAALKRRRARDAELIAGWETAAGTRAAAAPPWVRRLVLAADQFVVRRPLHDDADARSVLAGYPWFGDWGRDTAIALPGLTLATGRAPLGGAILRTFAHFVDGGMLPNYFPDGGEPAHYNSVDAALWYIEAVRRYHLASGDARTLRAVFPALRAIVAAYTAGTRYGIGVDPADGLLSAGEAGVQLTWMDAKVGDWVVTPRTGKPVEVNALWINALQTCAALAPAAGAGEEARAWTAAARRATASFERFWSAAHGWCFDVIDGPDGADPALRPNQIFAVALPIDVLDAARRRAIVNVCATRLWTPAGLRSLDAADPRYRGQYGGDQRSRDGAYHQGTVWTWLAGPFALALRRTGSPAAAATVLAAAAGGLDALALGTLAEIAEGDAPFAARGAVAQAWSVATVLDAWTQSA